MLARLGAFLASFSILASAYTTGQCSGYCEALDPSVVQRWYDLKYFRFSTGQGIPIGTANNLSGPWKSEGSVLPKGSSINLPNSNNMNLWAPDVHLIDGTYYLYYSISTMGTPNSTIGVATSQTLESGSWQDHGEIGLSSNDSSAFNAIDPNLIVVHDRLFLNFGSYLRDLQQVEMRDPLHRDPTSKPHQLSYNATGIHIEEGGFVFPLGPYYFLLFSAGLNVYSGGEPIAPGTEYRIVACRSLNPNGDFVDRQGIPCTKSGGDTLLESKGLLYGPGGQGVLDDVERGPVLYYHYANMNIGLHRSQFRFGWNDLCLSKDGWLSVCDRASRIMPTPGPSSPSPEVSVGIDISIDL